MNMHESARHIADDDQEREDFRVLTGGRFKPSGGDRAARKTLQLCSQVADTLNYVLSGECDDELLQNLQVASVVPAPDASQLLVTVYPVVATESTFNGADVRRRLLDAAGRLRSEVASSITRKKAPKLMFQLVDFVR